MAYEPELEPGETLEFDTAFQVTAKTPAFHFALSNRAVFWPAKKMFAMTDATYFKRLRHDEVQEVCVKRLHPYGLWTLALLLVLAGAAMLYLIYSPTPHHRQGDEIVTGWPFALIAGGILLPFVARGRYGLEIRTHTDTYRWKPPLVVDKPSKGKVRMVLDEIVEACEGVGLRVTDERS
jgi:hypothetical protein